MTPAKAETTTRGLRGSRRTDVTEAFDGCGIADRGAAELHDDRPLHAHGTISRSTSDFAVCVGASTSVVRAGTRKCQSCRLLSRPIAFGRPATQVPSILSTVDLGVAVESLDPESSDRYVVDVALARAVCEVGHEKQHDHSARVAAKKADDARHRSPSLDPLEA